ncbi:hypothetical protein DMENIID0001_006600 [Sergentomyia squamirostris]
MTFCHFPERTFRNSLEFLPKIHDDETSPERDRRTTEESEVIAENAAIGAEDCRPETAPQAARKRLKQLYFPMEGQKIRLPKMFEPKVHF